MEDGDNLIIWVNGVSYSVKVIDGKLFGSGTFVNEINLYGERS
jgi:hypothetical protein